MGAGHDDGSGEGERTGRLSSNRREAKSSIINRC